LAGKKSKILGQTKQSKFQWKRDPKQIEADNPNNIKLKASKHFENKKGRNTENVKSITLK
jgi:hypothetical protein